MSKNIGLTGDYWADVGAVICSDDSCIKSLLKGIMAMIGYDRLNDLLEQAYIERKAEEIDPMKFLCDTLDRERGKK